MLDECYSVTAMLFELGLPSFATVIHNYRHSFYRQWTVHCNPLVVHMHLFWSISACSVVLV